jgi:hypothetical protein
MIKYYPILVPALECKWSKEDFQFNHLQSPLTRAAMLVVTQLRAVISLVENMFPTEHPELSDALEWIAMMSNALDEIERAAEADERGNPGEEEPAIDGDVDWDAPAPWKISDGADTLAATLDEFYSCDDLSIQDDEIAEAFLQRMANYWLEDVLLKKGHFLLSILQGSVDPLAVIRSYEHLSDVICSE